MRSVVRGGGLSLPHEPVMPNTSGICTTTMMMTSSMPLLRADEAPPAPPSASAARKEAQAVRGAFPSANSAPAATGWVSALRVRRPEGRSPLRGGQRRRQRHYRRPHRRRRRAGSRKNVPRNYGPTKPVYSKEGKATAPRRAVGPSGAVELDGGDGDGGGGRGEGGRGRGRGRGREGGKKERRTVDSAVNEEAAAVLSSFVRGSASSSSSSPAEPPPLPPPDLSLLMTAEEVAAIQASGATSERLTEALTKRSKQRHRASPPSSYRG